MINDNEFQPSSFVLAREPELHIASRSYETASSIFAITRMKCNRVTEQDDYGLVVGVTRSGQVSQVYEERDCFFPWRRCVFDLRI